MEAAPGERDPKELWVIHGKAYDLTEFLKRHPGGSAVLLSVRGTDCTEQFERMHDDTRKPLAILKKMTPVDLPAEVLATFTAKGAEEGAAVAPSSPIQAETEPTVPPAKEEEDALSVIELNEQAEVYEDVDPDLLWYIHGKAYDLRDFVSKHPGGRDALESTQGRDCTALFESYHAFVDRPHTMLATLKEVRLAPAVLSSRVADVSKRGWFRLPDGTMDPLWVTLKERCRKKLEELGEPRTMPWVDFLYCMGLVAVIATVYTFGYLSWNWGVSVASAVGLGGLAWLLARLGHDGSHFAVSRYPWVNRLSTVLGSMCITNPSYWLLLHSVAHHSDTNQQEDPDMYHFDYVLRMTPEYPMTTWHRLQIHRWWVYGWWAFTVYGLTTDEPIRMLTMGAGTAPNPGIRLTKNRPLFWVCLVSHLLGFWFFGLFLPFYVKYHSPSLPVWGTFLAQLGVMLLYMAISGFFFGLFSQLNHFTEGSVDAAFKRTSWAQQQVETACDFAPQSLLWDILSSGINIQIEHHLFPTLSVQRLKAIVPVVQEVCREFGVEHQTFDTLGACLASVHRFLDAMAVEGCKLPALEAELKHGPRPPIIPPPSQ